MSFSDIVSFVTSLGFPTFVAIYLLWVYADDRKKNNEVFKLINEVRFSLESWLRISDSYLRVLETVSNKLDKLLETTTILLDRTCIYKRERGG
jgi:uncharacterized UPF0160 family protein